MDIPYYVELQRRMDVFRYVSCHEKNFDTHSVILESLLVDTCSFFDSLCRTFIREKSLAGFSFKREPTDFKNKVEGKGKAEFNCGDYRVVLEGDFALSKQEVNLNRYEDKLCLNPMQSSPDKMSGYLITPFREWATDNALPWWEAFTSLKHDRLRNFHEASLKNTLFSLAATFMILTLRNEAEFKAGSVPPEPYDLFFPKYWKWKGRLVPATFTWS